MLQATDHKLPISSTRTCINTGQHQHHRADKLVGQIQTSWREACRLFQAVFDHRTFVAPYDGTRCMNHNKTSAHTAHNVTQSSVCNTRSLECTLRSWCADANRCHHACQVPCIQRMPARGTNRHRNESNIPNLSAHKLSAELFQRLSDTRQAHKKDPDDSNIPRSHCTIPVYHAFAATHCNYLFKTVLG